MDMPGMMMGPNSQGSKLPHNPNASLSHNILLQQSQLGKFSSPIALKLSINLLIIITGQIPQSYSTSGNHNLHNTLHPYDAMDAYQSL